MEPAYVLALSTGLLGGFGHCIGMCGPLVASYALSHRPESAQPFSRTLAPHLFYNAGRIATYAAIGAAMGLSGSFLNVAGSFAGVQNCVALLAGVFMIIMGLGTSGIWGNSRWIERHNLPVLRAAHGLQASASPYRFLGLGLLLGLLPCGLSYTIFIAAAGSGNILSGMMTSLLFGLGTLPAMLAAGWVLSSLGARLRGAVYRASGVLVIAMGVYFLYKGIRLYARL
jgi:hypothetical protein